MNKYLSIMGMFLAGVIMVIIGVYFFLSYGSGSANFQIGLVVMLIGLLVTGVGAIRGKRNMRSVGYFAEYSQQQPTRQAPQMRAAPGPEGPETVPEPATEPRPPAERPTPTEPVKSGRTAAAPGPAAPAAQARVIKVIICPKCGTENQETDTFCFSCGKKLRPKGAARKSK
jgi:ribosomal protein L40E